MGGKMSAAWWRDYRARNRDRVNERLRERRRERPRERGDRAREYARRALRRDPSRDEDLLPVWSSSHPLIERAKAIVDHRPRGVVLSFREDELAMDCVGVAVLAMLEDRDPRAAVRRYRAVETSWIRTTAPLLLDPED